MKSVKKGSRLETSLSAAFFEAASQNKDARRWLLLQAKIKENQIQKIFALFRQESLEPILIKGWSIARFYPFPGARPSVDIDLAVAPENFVRAQSLVEKHNLKSEVDLHNGLRHLDSLSFSNLFEHSELHKIGETDIRTLRPEDNLRVLCVHWLTDGGEYPEKLWDIYYAVKNRPPDFDWDRCLNVVSRVRQSWIISTIALAHRYLNLDVSETPLKDTVNDLPRWFIETIEREWANETRIIPLGYCWKKPDKLWKQIRKRVPPNPIHSSIMCEAPIDESPRLKYQVANFFSRILPSFKKNLLNS